MIFDVWPMIKLVPIPDNATLRQGYVTYGNPECQQLHNPYLCAYWKKTKDD